MTTTITESAITESAMVYAEMQTVASVVANVYPPHEVKNSAKAEQLAEAMQQDGWQGPPLFIWEGNIALCGSHRIAALSLLDCHLDVPVVDLSECYAELLGSEAEEAIDEAVGEYQSNPYATFYDLAEAICQAAIATNREVAEALGLDVGGV